MGPLYKPLSRGAFTTKEALRRLIWWRPVFSSQCLAVKRQGCSDIWRHPQFPHLHDNTEVHLYRSSTLLVLGA